MDRAAHKRDVDTVGFRWDGGSEGGALVEVHHPTTALSMVDAVAIGPDGSVIASAGDKVVRVWGWTAARSWSRSRTGAR